ncbi:MAG: hypothetical protein WCP45_13765 [Verrucomicrobiota bacterium]
MATHITPRKARGDSKLDSLPPARLAELVQGLLCGWSYMQAIDWLQVECGFSVSLSAFTPFYKRHVEPVLRERKQFAALSAKTLARMASETEAFDAAAIGELKEYAYRLIRDPSSDPEDARKWMETLIKAQSGSRDDRKLKLLEQKAAQADAAKDVLGTSLSPEEQNRRLREILK